MSNDVNLDRRRFLFGMISAVAASQLVVTHHAYEQPRREAVTQPRLNQDTDSGSFGALKQIDAGVLNVWCAEVGPTDGPAASAPIMASRHRR